MLENDKIIQNQIYIFSEYFQLICGHDGIGRHVRFRFLFLWSVGSSPTDRIFISGRMFPTSSIKSVFSSA